MADRRGVQARVLVVGSGTRFLSGISIYTIRLANALATRHHVGIVTMRSLLPRRLYPGWKRVGADLARIRPASGVDVFDGVDWYWLPSIFRAAWFVVHHRPQFVILEWWTGTVLHSYIALTLLAKALGAKVIVEFHEIIETGEANIPLARRYVHTVFPILLRLAHAYAVHSHFDRALAQTTWHLSARKPLAVLPHGPHDHYRGDEGAVAVRDAAPGVTNLLFFGVIRPYKGLEHLISAFEAISDVEIGNYWLTVVGETWEGWTLPTDLIAASPRRARMTFVNRYVTDEELHRYLLGSDAVVLPYLRSSLSGPLHVAMGYGLPIVMTDVGGNSEAARGYGGIVLVPPGDAASLTAAFRNVRAMREQRFAHPHSWSNTAEAYDLLFKELL
jgi:glycosyltransferase involved in cell wall biosynthesis